MVETPAESPRRRWYDFVFGDFLGRFCYYLPLPLTLLAILGLLLGMVGEGYGVRYLVGHENEKKQLLSGFALTLVCIECLYLGYLLDTEKRRRCFKGPFVLYALGTGALFLISVALVAGVYLVIRHWSHTPDDAHEGLLAPLQEP